MTAFSRFVAVLTAVHADQFQFAVVAVDEQTTFTLTTTTTTIKRLHAGSLSLITIAPIRGHLAAAASKSHKTTKTTAAER